MRSEFLLGIAGFVIVMTALVGGLFLASVCHELLTPNLDFVHMIWLWICGIPFWWLLAQTRSDKPLEHPAATYVIMLPLGVLLDVLFRQLGPDSPWFFPCMLIVCAVYFETVERVVLPLIRRRASHNDRHDCHLG